MQLPIIENDFLLETEIDKCTTALEQIEPMEESQSLSDVKRIFTKIKDERQYWGVSRAMKEFTCGMNASSRNEMIKIQLQKDIILSLKYPLPPIDDVLNYLIDFGWLNKCQEGGDMVKQEEKETSCQRQDTGNSSPKKATAALLPLTYDEFKITRAAQIENLEIMKLYLRTNLTAYACERAKYNIVQGLKYWRQHKHDKINNIFLLKLFPPNQNRDNDRRGDKTTIDLSGHNVECNGNGKMTLEGDKFYCKVVEIGQYIFCTCMEYFNTGIPCVHQFSVALKSCQKLLFNERWFKSYERLAIQSPEKLTQIRSQNI